MIGKTFLEKEKEKVFQLAEGQVRATTLQGHFDYVREKEGEEGVKKFRKN